MAEWRKWSVQHDGSVKEYEGKRVCDPPGFDPAAAREVRLVFLVEEGGACLLPLPLSPPRQQRAPAAEADTLDGMLLFSVAGSSSHSARNHSAQLCSHPPTLHSAAGRGQRRHRARQHQAAPAEAAGAAAAAGAGAAQAGAGEKWREWPAADGCLARLCLWWRHVAADACIPLHSPGLWCRCSSLNGQTLAAKSMRVGQRSAALPSTHQPGAGGHASCCCEMSSDNRNREAQMYNPAPMPPRHLVPNTRRWPCCAS